MYKLATTSGKPLRAEFSDFEIRAAKYAVENNICKGETFTFGNSDEAFSVTENNENNIVIVRLKNYNNIEFLKVQPGKKVKQEQTVIYDSQPTITVESKPTTTTPAKTDVANTVSQAVLTALSGLNIGGIDKAAVNALIEKKIDALKDAHTTRIQINEAPAVKIDGVKHKCFDDVITWAKGRYNVYLLGPAGTGKTCLAKQVTEALGLPFYTTGAVQQPYDLLGYKDVNGNYVSTPFYEAFVNGGGFLFDEIDGSPASVLVAFNQALANRQMTFPDGVHKAHPDFIALAAANTNGGGQTEEFCGRFQIDRSTLDRFVAIDVDYDKDIEMKLANKDKDLVEFTHLVRSQIKGMNLPYQCTPRFIQRMVYGLANNMPLEKLMKQTLTGFWNSEDIKLVASGLPISSNKYIKALKGLAK